ncbi:hypothetical protein ACFX2I_003149 [Malus domestica]
MNSPTFFKSEFISLYLTKLKFLHVTIRVLQLSSGKMVKNKSTNDEKKPSFFRILVAGYNTEYLHIPRDFLKHIQKDLFERAFLTLTDSLDCSWSVKVSRTTMGAVRFTDGWQEFLRDNSLGHGNFLVVIYDGRMKFSITVFGMTACEREVGSTKIGSTNQNSTFADTTKMPSGGGGKRKCDGSSSKRPHPSSSCSNDDSGENLCEPEEDDEDSTSNDWDDDEDNTSDEESEDDTSEEDMEAAAESESFKSKFPHFKSVIRTSSNVYVPAAFSRKHFSKQRHFKIFMKNAEEKTWAVNVVHLNTSHSFSAGWSRFASSNQIGIGDTCIFELLSSNEMKVRIIQKASV